MKKFILLLSAIFLTLGVCTYVFKTSASNDNKYKELTFEQYKEKIKKQDSFFIYFLLLLHYQVVSFRHPYHNKLSLALTLFCFLQDNLYIHFYISITLQHKLFCSCLLSLYLK